MFRNAALVMSRARQMSQSAPTALPVDVWRKRLLYHASKRGMRENEVVLGRFAAKALPGMSVRQMQLFEQFLNQYDPDVNKWLLRKEPIPVELDNEVRARSGGDWKFI